LIKALYPFFFFKVAGWKIDGNVPAIKKYLIIVAPHSSNWDFLVGLAVRSILNFDAKYLAKKELFKFPFGGLFKKLGGYPVDRSKKTNLVDAVVDLFKEHERFSIAMTPEGTRKYVPHWKTGFYHIAVKGNLPIVMAAMDYETKTVFFALPFIPTGDWNEDMKKISQFYIDKKGKNKKLWPDEFYSLTGRTKPTQ
jgi:1-acyl-sn-glycerol-3-phosphate acyltransferase